MKSKRNHAIRTSLANSGRAAGMGILYDDYSEDSGKSTHYESTWPIFQSDLLSEEEKEALNSPVIIKRLEDCNDSKVCRALLEERRGACQEEGLKRVSECIQK